MFSSKLASRARNCKIIRKDILKDIATITVEDFIKVSVAVMP